MFKKAVKKSKLKGMTMDHAWFAVAKREMEAKMAASTSNPTMYDQLTQYVGSMGNAQQSGVGTSGTTTTNAGSLGGLAQMAPGTYQQWHGTPTPTVSNLTVDELNDVVEKACEKVCA